MTKQTIRLGAIIKISNSEHSMFQKNGRYMGPVELPGIENRHRICFDGKVHIIQEQDFEEVAEIAEILVDKN